MLFKCVKGSCSYVCGRSTVGHRACVAFLGRLEAPGSVPFNASGEYAHLQVDAPVAAVPATTPEPEQTATPIATSVSTPSTPTATSSPSGAAAASVTPGTPTGGRVSQDSSQKLNKRKPSQPPPARPPGGPDRPSKTFGAPPPPPPGRERKGTGGNSLPPLPSRPRDSVNSEVGECLGYLATGANEHHRHRRVMQEPHPHREEPHPHREERRHRR